MELVDLRSEQVSLKNKYLTTPVVEIALKTWAVSGIIAVAVGVLVLSWGQYVLWVDRRFERDVPQFLTAAYVETYGLSCVRHYSVWSISNCLSHS